MTPSEAVGPNVAVEPIADDANDPGGVESAADPYGTAEHLAAIERAYAEALAHIAAMADSEVAAEVATLATGKLAVATGRPSVTTPHAA
ncbi:hypothetical protein [Modestobacter excelsi]|uniref:hypothetical protein n=1 Tax=Modestobacter excelsi TaxID=2213161 RepID=UPI00110CBC6C|nr:hypothetical protein [Modestobacter excelsi]